MEIRPYTDDELAEVLSNEFTPKEIIKGKHHFLYLTKYLGAAGLKASTMIIEDQYVSRDYLYDYTSYYAYCFEPYNNFCKRIHFFSSKETKESITSFILDDTEESSQKYGNSYLGFIVVKPIPITVIGITILKTYSNKKDFDARYFWGIRKYTVHFFGKEIQIDSLAFQEQDSVLAACATTAIWSMLNKASIDHYTILKSPNQITTDADNVASDGSRLFPNKGLNILQISQAIFNSGLVSEIKKGDHEILNKKGEVVAEYVSNSYLKKIINAYSPIGIPLILIVKVPTGDTYGLHALTVSGYHKKAPVSIKPKKEISYLSDNIEKIYAHDDQWGPFVRLTFDGDVKIESPWTSNSKKKAPTYTTNVVVPLYPKIRISYEDINVITLGLDAIFTFFFDNKIIGDLVWDIRLRYSEDFKSIIRNDRTLKQEEKVKILTDNQPKYLWVVTCYVDNAEIFDFTFDATGVKNGMIGKHVVCYLPISMKKELNKFLKLNESFLGIIFNHRASSLYYKFLIEETK